MSLLKKTLLSVAAVAAFGISALANASVITDVQAPATAVQITVSTPYTFIQDITDQNFAVGDTVSAGATLAIFLSDPNQGGEKYTFEIGNNQTIDYTNDNIPNRGSLTKTVTLSASSLLDLNEDGKLSITIRTYQTGSNIQDEFFFVSSTLNGNLTKAPKTEPTSEVPEPTTVALLGLGLLGVAASRRKSAKSKNA